MSREEYRKIRDFGALLKFVYALNVSKRNIVHAIEMHTEEDHVQLDIYVKRMLRLKSIKPIDIGSI